MNVPLIYLRRLTLDRARAKLLHEIELYFARGYEKVKVIHGVGTYVIHNMVVEEIAKIDYVEHIQTPLSFNDGELYIRLLIPKLQKLHQIMEW